VARRVAQRLWKAAGTWQRNDCTLLPAVEHQGPIIGCQNLGAKDLADVREGLVTARFGRRFHGHGHGHGHGPGPTSRAAVLDLVFDGLGAEDVLTVICQDNSPALGVTRRLGFRPDGVQVNVVGGGRAVSTWLWLSREQWLKSKRIDVRIEG
jgi:RimJ/RimL family protein N-acetyltransferase